MHCTVHCVLYTTDSTRKISSMYERQINGLLGKMNRLKCIEKEEKHRNRIEISFDKRNKGGGMDQQIDCN